MGEGSNPSPFFVPVSQEEKVMRTPAKALIAIILAGGDFFAGYMANRQPAPVVSPAATEQAPTYGCPMHPQVHVRSSG